MSPHRFQLPISARHAFALAFDLAFRRDPLHSLIVPLLVQAPWVLATASLREFGETDQPAAVVGTWAAAQLGSIFVWLVISAMLRFRARSVFNSPPGTRPEEVTRSYARGLARVPWLLVTEIARNLALVFGFLCLIIPGLFLGFRLAVATEAIVLDEPHMANAFQRSFRLTQGRFERWFEMILLSVMMVLGCALVGAVLSLTIPGLDFKTWTLVTELLIALLLPVILYAWTFFYLRLVEAEGLDPGTEVGPAYADSGPASETRPVVS
jgi:hypothetical protein